MVGFLSELLIDLNSSNLSLELGAACPLLCLNLADKPLPSPVVHHDFGVARGLGSGIVYRHLMHRFTGWAASLRLDMLRFCNAQAGRKAGFGLGGVRVGLRGFVDLIKDEVGATLGLSHARYQSLEPSILVDVGLLHALDASHFVVHEGIVDVDGLGLPRLPPESGEPLTDGRHESLLTSHLALQTTRLVDIDEVPDLNCAISIRIIKAAHELLHWNSPLRVRFRPPLSLQPQIRRLERHVR